MKRVTLLLGFALGLFAQSTVYLHLGTPHGAIVDGATNATPVVLTTRVPHGFATTCGTSTVCYCAVEAVSMGLGQTHVNGNHRCHYVDSTHLSVYDFVADTPIAGEGNWWNGVTWSWTGHNGSWVSAIAPVTLPNHPYVMLDGPTGETTRRTTLRTLNGLTSLVVSGGSGSSCASITCVVTVTTSYDPTIAVAPTAVGDKFSINSTSTNLDICGSGGGKFAPYTIASVSSSGWVSTAFTCSGLTTGDKTNLNLHCGATSTPNNLRGGTLSCTSVSQNAYTGNPWWDNIITFMGTTFTTFPDYQTVFDGGNVQAAPAIITWYSWAALRFLVEPDNDFMLAETVYAITHDYRSHGVSYNWNEGSDNAESNADFVYTPDEEALGLLYGITQFPSNYLAAADKSAFFDRQLNDTDDPDIPGISTTEVDLKDPSNHNWVLGSGLVQAGTNDATHVTLASSGHCIPGTVIMLHNGTQDSYAGNAYRHVTSCAGAIATTPSSTAVLPNGVISGTYQGGLTCTGTTGQYVAIDIGPGTVAQAKVYLTGTNTMPANGTALDIFAAGIGFSTPPTTSVSDPNYSTASCSGSATVTTVLGMKYTVFDTVITSTTTFGATATMTFSGTSSLAGTISVGDAVIATELFVGFQQLSPQECYVTAVGTNTVTCINNLQVLASTTQPLMAWRIIPWHTGQAGRQWGMKHQVNTFGSVLPSHPPSPQGMEEQGLFPDNFLNPNMNAGGNDWVAWTYLYLALAEDPRAQREISRSQAHFWDWKVPLQNNMSWPVDGSGYGNDTDYTMQESNDFLMRNALAGASVHYPDFNWPGAWKQDVARYVMFSSLPDLRGGAQRWAPISAAAANYGVVGSAQEISVSNNPVMNATPTGTMAKMYRNWLERVTSYGIAPTSYMGLTLSTEAEIGFLHNVPNIPSLDYRTQPHQYAFTGDNLTTCTSVLGYDCRLTYNHVMVSRTGWASLADTLMVFDTRTFSIGYDCPRVGDVWLYKGSYLRGSDFNAPGVCYVGADPSIINDIFQIGGDQTRWDNEFSVGFYGGHMLSPSQYNVLTNWASANAGSMGTQYGDQNSNYAYGCTDTKGNYNTSNLGVTLGYVRRCVVDFKKSSGDQFIMQFDDVASTSTQLAWHLQLVQNGTPFVNPNQPSGLTTCPGVGGCAAINTNGRVIQSVEDGTPGNTFGLMTHIDSPGTITVRDDCLGKGGGQCAPGDTYPGGSGSSHRFTIGGGTIGSNQTAFTSVVEHKLMQTVSDSTFVPVGVNPDSNWTGGGACGAVSCAYYVEARNNTTQSTITTFTVTPSLASQYLLGGLTPGAYTPFINGVALTTCNGHSAPCTVSAGDNSLYFEDTHTGTVTVGLNGSISGGPTILNGMTVGGMIVH